MRVITIVEYDHTSINNLSSMLARHILGVCLLFTLLSQELPLELQLCNKETSIQTVLLRYFDVLNPSTLWLLYQRLLRFKFLLRVRLQYEIVLTNYCKQFYFK